MAVHPHLGRRVGGDVRSDPPCSTIDFNNWFSVGGMTTDSSDLELDERKLASVYTIDGIDERV